jgi:hypothetical protein
MKHFDSPHVPMVMKKLHFGLHRAGQVFIWSALAAFFFYARQSVGQTTPGSAFTYQGKLTRSGVAVSGQYDLLFSLYDAETAGNALGQPVPQANQTVKSGIFSVILDFGADTLLGGRRWLEISVRPAAPPIGPPEAYVTLPRQELTPAPYAITALRAQGVPNGMQEFLVSGQFSVPSGVTRLMVDAVGGGGYRPTFVGGGISDTHFPLFLASCYRLCLEKEERPHMTQQQE